MTPSGNGSIAFGTEAERTYNVVLTLTGKSGDDRSAYWALLVLGDIKLDRGNLAGPLEAYRQAAADADRLTKADANNAGWQRGVAMSYERLILIYLDTGEKTKALQMLSERLWSA